MGLDLATLRQVRTMAAESVSGPAKGKCPSTCIWLGLGGRYDRAIKTVIAQINTWLDIAPWHDQQVRMTRAWYVQRNRHHSAKDPWQIVNGHMGAIIATLDPIGWNPVSPFTWLDQDGSRWKSQQGDCREELAPNVGKVSASGEKVWDYIIPFGKLFG